MKRIITIIIFVLPISIFSQSLNENPYLSYYLGPNIQESSVGTILGRTYDGVAKMPLSRNIPSTWIYYYTLNHLPVTARYSDFITPFGRSYMSINGGTYGSSIGFLGSFNGEMDMTLNGRYAMNQKKSIDTSIQLNYHHNNSNIDRNQDGFLDLDRKKKFMGINHWSFKRKNYRGSLTGYHLYLDQAGGEVQFDKKTDYLSQNAYGKGILMNHSGIATQHSWKFMDDNDDQIKGELFADGEVRITDMTRFYGLNEYKADELLLNAYTGYKFKKNLTDWEFGLHFRNENLKESYADSQITQFNVSIPGIYARSETQLGYRLKLYTDLRVNYHSDQKEVLIHPGLRLTYVPADRMALSIFAGNGTRYARALSEHHRFLYSNRELNMNESLLPERAWHYGLSYRWSYNKFFEPVYDWSIGNFKYFFLFYHNIYQNLNVADISEDNMLIFRNHDEKAYKTSLNNRLFFSPYRHVDVTFMHRYDVFKMENNGILENRLYHPRNSFMFSLDFRFRSYVEMNTQIHVIGKTPASALAYADGYAPKRKRWDVSFVVPINAYLGNFNAFKKFDIILGFDNITGNKLNEAVIGSENPFSNEFEGGLTEGSPMGSRIYGGVKIDF